MNDPTRIDKVLSALQDAWEGQPDLPLATIFGMLANAGYGWGTPDGQLIVALEEMAAIHPPSFPPGASVEGLWLLEGKTQGAGEVEQVFQATFDSQRIIVQTGPSGLADRRQPVVWNYGAIRATGPLRPLVVADLEGVWHRLGLVERISRLEPADMLLTSLSGLRRSELGEYVYLVRTQEATVRLGSTCQVFSPGRRNIEHRQFAWTSVEQCLPGHALSVVDRDGLVHQLGVVGEVLIAKAPICQ